MYALTGVADTGMVAMTASFATLTGHYDFLLDAPHTPLRSADRTRCRVRCEARRKRSRRLSDARGDVWRDGLGKRTTATRALPVLRHIYRLCPTSFWATTPSVAPLPPGCRRVHLHLHPGAVCRGRLSQGREPTIPTARPRTRIGL
ncbi:hypothetical protein BD626DRAFT_171977 [Schizophyllum amplum]|uniref:Uncharacterized protein n=1 Tax=Schizophyllum amplum TaxID=97359 RepID=A0A550BV92_9AGAR|nr:hypothetical protein BD626DRAFT_248625 [Auriculariopsis ampla]TRM59119.1 hypothetical protein BD626DRAFT_171977 [Auriculariopsis ampla]